MQAATNTSVGQCTPITKREKPTRKIHKSAIDSANLCAAGQIRLTHSVSAGLDYAAVGPEHAWLHDTGRAEYSYVTDDEAVAAFHQLARWEGLLSALESIHAVAWVIRHARRRWSKRDLVIVNLSGRGDKDVQQIAAWEQSHEA